MPDTDPTPVPARMPFRMVLLSVAGLWLCYFAITTARGMIVGLEFEYDMLGRRALVCVAGGAITLILWLVLRLFDNRPLWAKIAGALIVSAPLSILIAQVNQLAFAEVEKQMIDDLGEQQGVRLYRDEAGNLLAELPGTASGAGLGRTVTLARAPSGFDRWRQLTDIALGRYFLLLAWCALYLAMLAGAQARAAERREGEFRRAAKAAELRSLRYQVNPHFLFNTLNSLSSLVMTGKAERAEDMIQAVSNFYRHSLADDPTSDVALRDEFDLQRQYLAIEEVRFPERLRSEFDLPAALGEARIPGMILQPLVENSVKYAVAPRSRPVTIRLSVREEYGRLVVTVSDNGPGVPDDTQHGFGIGLANVRDRLRARFGADAQISSGPVPGGYSTELRMPKVIYD